MINASIRTVYYNVYYLLFLRCCPLCRTTIHSWTTKKFVQFILDKEKQHPEISEYEQIKETEGSQVPPLNEGCVDLKHDKPQQGSRSDIIAGTNLGHTSNEPCETYYELCRFDSSDNFLNCLKCLDAAKAVLTFFDIILILRSNLSIGLCRKHLVQIIDGSKSCNMILGLQYIENTVRYLLRMAQTILHLTIKTDAREKQDNPFHNIKLAVCQISLVTVNAFPSHSEKILEKETVIIVMIDEIFQLLN